MLKTQPKSGPASGFKQFIGGTRVQPQSHETIPIVNPATEETIAVMPKATPAEAVQAIEAARKAFDHGPWPRLSAKERSAALKRFAQALEKRRDALVDIAVRQNGALIGLAKGLQVARPIENAYWFADRAATFPLVDTIKLDGPPFDTSLPHQRVRLVQRAPAGVVCAITPFNYPLLLNILKVFPALAVGCTVVLKPTPTTCWDAVLMAEAAEEAALPEGVLSILLGGEGDVGEVMASHPMVDVITFTGSTATGRRIMELASKTVKKITLELGGKSPNIVFADADLEKFFLTDPVNLRHCGQGCGQLTRILVEEPIYDKVVARLVERAKALRIGMPEDPSTELGPVVSKKQYDRVMGYIEIGQDEGAKMLTGGKRPAHLPKGCFIEPTVFADVDNKMRIAQEEIFGPVPVVIKFKGEEQAVQIANDSIYGINSSVWTEDQAKALRVAGRLQVGNVGLNCHADVLEGPHGGFKQTGIGREWRDWSLNEFVEMKGYSYFVGQ